MIETLERKVFRAMPAGKVVGVSRFNDEKYMTDLITREDIWSLMTGGDMAKRDKFTMSDVCGNANNVFLLITVNGEHAGFVSFVDNNFGIYQVHMTTDNHCRGWLAMEALRKACQWMFVHAGAAILLGMFPVENRRVSIFIRLCGFSFVGCAAGVSLTILTHELWKNSGSKL